MNSNWLCYLLMCVVEKQIRLWLFHFFLFIFYNFSVSLEWEKCETVSWRKKSDFRVNDLWNIVSYFQTNNGDLNLFCFVIYIIFVFFFLLFVSFLSSCACVSPFLISIGQCLFTIAECGCCWWSFFMQSSSSFFLPSSSFSSYIFFFSFLHLAQHANISTQNQKAVKLNKP